MASRSRREEHGIAKRARAADRLDEKWFGGPRPREQLTGETSLELSSGCSWVGPLPTMDEQLPIRRRRA